jgi:acyl dehydratase
LTFDELIPGDEWESPARTVTESDVVTFAGLSGDFNPIHVDHHASKGGAFGKPVAHGLLGLSIASGLSSHAPHVETIAFLAIQEWKFLQPITFGDTIKVITKVESVQPRARGRRALITWKRTLVNQHGVVVQQGTTQTLVKGRTGNPASDSEQTETGEA